MTELPMRAGEIDVWICAGPQEGSDAAIDRLLGSYPGLAAAGRRHRRDEEGRPVVCGYDEVRISVSHTEGLLLLAVATHCQVGVDVEQVRERGLARLPQHALTRAERDQLERHRQARQSEVFLGYWVRKEALLKAAGTGLAVDPRLIELAPSGRAAHPRTVPATLGCAEEWWIVELDLAGFAAALAVDVSPSRVRIRPLAARDEGPVRPARDRRWRPKLARRRRAAGDRPLAR